MCSLYFSTRFLPLHYLRNFHTDVIKMFNVTLNEGSILLAITELEMVTQCLRHYQRLSMALSDHLPSGRPLLNGTRIALSVCINQIGTSWPGTYYSESPTHSWHIFAERLETWTLLRVTAGSPLDDLSTGSTCHSFRPSHLFTSSVHEGGDVVGEEGTGRPQVAYYTAGN
ncbi:hypothetical protein H4582DRAFT_2061670 [Lactarius indigo]|nr:hypothetical protein H4582DRAFT_2061670 [Lactarius indigo]